MPSSYFSRQKVLQASVDILLGRGQSLSVSNSGFFQSHPFATLFNNIRLFRRADHPTALPITGALPCTIRVPSVTGPSCQSGLYQVDSLVSEPIQRFPFILFQRNIMSTGNSLCVEAEMAARHLDNLHMKSGQILNNVMRADVCFHNKSLDYCRRVSGSLKNRETWGNNMIYKCFWSNAAGKSLGPYPFLESKTNGILSLWSAAYSTRAAPDVSFDCSPREEQPENSSVSSNEKKLGDKTLKLLSGSCYLPHPDKEETGGEDAHFICDEQAIGVADGVGGWADLGVDAGQYARELMSHSVAAIQEEPKGSINPARVLEKAYSSTKAKGSSTACIIALTHQGIHAVNLGDSGFIVVRDGCTIFRSPVQQHDFNFTYQLESGNASDLPSAAQVFTFPVAAGDVIVAGTDGLFDNLYNNEITAVVVHAIRAGLEPQVTAQKIAALARQRAQDKNRQTPFSSAAQEAGYRYYGGKLDDITVVVSYVTAFGA
ncbi:probable protein phosphatase 2C 55 [Phoenix dactylifera]|uniref:Protein phosphatase n=1 Tax=Phoenix dactylifera TaxID=42345 RepID=A0A8B7CGW0_PHODC|nr:probable protein phosphatase 2C 55 [Phoenix dactylifera]XP_008798755.1 probable protein phosphatase 2C 55 [Phoenix dactylifera]XP_008798756.1 probable protein phosphatase 2C 55 [Phoenix dactylifera]